MVINQMEDEIRNFNPNDFITPRLLMKMNKSAYLCPKNIFEKIMKYEKLRIGLLERGENAAFIETYIVYITFCLKKHIIEKMKRKISKQWHENISNFEKENPKRCY
jgi:hypothetical protein